MAGKPKTKTCAACGRIATGRHCDKCCRRMAGDEVPEWANDENKILELSKSMRVNGWTDDKGNWHKPHLEVMAEHPKGVPIAPIEERTVDTMGMIQAAQEFTE